MALKEDLTKHLDAISEDIRLLLECIDVKQHVPLEGPGSAPSANLTLDQVLEKITRREEQVKRLVETAISMKQRQKDVREAEMELDKYKSETDQLQAKLIEAEKILELSLYQAKEKLKSIRISHEGMVSVEDLISYAHKISLANSVASPTGWHASNDPRRPYPSDSHMRGGLLGQLSMSNHIAGAKKGTFELSSPPKSQGVAPKAAMHPQHMPRPMNHDTEFMTTEDSSSSSDENL